MKQAPPNVNITQDMVNNAPTIKCPKKDCDGDNFLSVVRYKKISKLAAGTPSDLLVPLESLACIKCGKEFSMEELVHPENNELSNKIKGSDSEDH